MTHDAAKEAISSVMGKYGQAISLAYIEGTEIPPQFYDDMIAKLTEMGWRPPDPVAQALAMIDRVGAP
jgi:hypothetical protein